MVPLHPERRRPATGLFVWNVAACLIAAAFLEISMLLIKGQHAWEVLIEGWRTLNG